MPYFLLNHQSHGILLTIAIVITRAWRLLAGSSASVFVGVRVQGFRVSLGRHEGLRLEGFRV